MASVVTWVPSRAPVPPTQVNWRNFRPTIGLLCEATRQMMPARVASCMCVRNDTRPLTQEAAAPVRDFALGSVLGDGGAAPAPNDAATWRAQNETMQAAAASTALRVPLLIGNDSVHGQNNLRGSTLYPHHIGLGCMREGGEPDEAMVERLAAVAAAESMACGINWMFTPCVAVPQDLRWGRTYEGFAEDPTIVGRLGAAEVRGVQQQPFPMASCLKHWAADGGTRYGSGTALFFWSGAPVHVLDQGDAVMDEEEMRRM